MVALDYIQEHPGDAVTLERLSRVAGLSANHFQGLFTRLVGMSPRDFCDHRRLARLKELLRSGASVTESAYGAGYGSIRALYEKSARNLGMTPATYKRGGAGLRVRYVILDSSLGSVLVAYTDLGLCSVLVGESAESVLGEISGELPRAFLDRQFASTLDWNAAARACDRTDPFLSMLSFGSRCDIFRAQMMRMCRRATARP